MLQQGRVRVNGEIERDARCGIAPSDVVDVAQKSVHRNLPPEIAVLYEDEHLIVILKANGLLTVPTERERDTTVQACLNRYLKGYRGAVARMVSAANRPGIAALRAVK